MYQDENLDWISDDFLDSLLKSCPEESSPLLDQFLITDPGPLNTFNLDCSSDSGTSSKFRLEFPILFERDQHTLLLITEGLSYGPDCSPGRSIRMEDDLCLNDALLETDSLIHDVKDIKLTKDETNTASDESCEVLSYDSIDFVKEEEVECEEVFDSGCLIDTNSCKLRVSETVRARMKVVVTYLLYFSR